MRSRALIHIGRLALVGVIGISGGIAGLGLGGCATPAAKAACYPISGWASPVFRCAGAPTPVAVVTPPPAPEPPPPPRAEAKAELIELSEHVEFETASAVLLDRSKQLLDDVARELTDHPEIRKVQIEGHTDSTASNRTNLRLSKERIASVRSYLIGKGIEPNRLSVKAFGERKPTASNKTEEGRARNRRVEFRILQRR